MIDFTTPEFYSYTIFGVILNFVFSMALGVYLSKNIGIEEMVLSKGDQDQPWWMFLTLIIPFAKMVITLYRVAILQFYFLNEGKTHKDFWIYLTSK
ncbi:MAG: hypothetical protein Q8J85_09030 [Sulfuricurvum sp.]|nr:hypothetical protein [Sulfuricurvum sp.]MDP3023634.1 hypothetical protein [Sulfuricurvum sp.]